MNRHPVFFWTPGYKNRFFFLGCDNYYCDQRSNDNNRDSSLWTSSPIKGTPVHPWRLSRVPREPALALTRVGDRRALSPSLPAGALNQFRMRVLLLLLLLVATLTHAEDGCKWSWKKLGCQPKPECRMTLKPGNGFGKCAKAAAKTEPPPAEEACDEPAAEPAAAEPAEATPAEEPAAAEEAAEA